jgi:hypothetical protein
MNKSRLFLLVLTAMTALTLVWCSAGCTGSSSDDDFQYSSSPQKKSKTATAKKTIAVTPQKGPLFTEVKFVSKTRVNEDLEVKPVLSGSAEDDFTFSYRWVVNEEEVPEIDSHILPKRYFKKDDWVYCIVTGTEEGGETRTIKSKFVRISGMTPMLDLAPVGNFSAPGKFRYKIRASLPTTEEFFQTQESSRLKYQLISPLDVGINLDPDTGLITWDITTDTIETYGKEFEIKFKVSNPEGGEVTSSIILTFTPAEAGEQQEEAQNP